MVREEQGMLVDSVELDATRTQGSMLAASFKSGYTSKKMGYSRSYPKSQEESLWLITITL